MKFSSIKTQLIFFLAGYALFLSIKDKDTAFLLAAFIAVISCVSTDSAISYLKNRKLTLAESSIISGLIIGFVLSSDQPRWIYVVAAVFAISSKHFIRIKDKHLFNPAAFGLFSAIILCGAETQWKGTYLWYVLIPAGLYFAYRVRRLEVIVGYSLTVLVLFGAQAFIQKVSLLNIFGYLSYFYIFVMVIEPKTTPIRPRGKMLFGIGVAALIFILTAAGVKFDVELCSLLALNSVVPIFNKLPK